MALPDANTQETFDTVGEREDLSDIIYNIDPTETPFLMMAGRGTASAVRHEWQVDALTAPLKNVVAEGDDASIVAVQPTVKVANHCQISSKAIIVTGTLEAIDKAGRASELSYQLAKRSKELKRDIEHSCVGISNSSLASTTGTGGETASVAAFFDQNLADAGSLVLPGTHQSRGSGGTDTGWNGTLFIKPGDGTQRPLLESDFKGVLQGAWTNGGNPTIAMCGPFNKTVISSFTGNSTRFDKGEDKRITAAVDVYISDFGEIRAVPNRFSRSRDVYCLTPELWSVNYLRDFRQHALSKTGDSEKRQLLVEYTLVGKNQSGNGVVADLTTA